MTGILTAHRQLGPRLGTYRPGWVILDDDGLVATVKSRKEAEAIVKAQRLPSDK